MTEAVPELELVPQTVEPDWWHIYEMPDGSRYVWGPTTITPAVAATLDPYSGTYQESLDHEPPSES